MSIIIIDFRKIKKERINNYSSLSSLNSSAMPATEPKTPLDSMVKIF